MAQEERYGVSRPDFTKDEVLHLRKNISARTLIRLRMLDPIKEKEPKTKYFLTRKRDKGIPKKELNAVIVAESLISGRFSAEGDKLPLTEEQATNFVTWFEVEFPKRFVEIHEDPTSPLHRFPPSEPDAIMSASEARVFEQNMRLWCETCYHVPTIRAYNTSDGRMIADAGWALEPEADYVRDGIILLYEQEATSLEGVNPLLPMHCEEAKASEELRASEEGRTSMESTSSTSSAGSTVTELDRATFYLPTKDTVWQDVFIRRATLTTI
ncbi:hypothetical protein QBC46DRAFT_346082 [Diplogelasinospora grovesii]|uniref:Uncharacterized protein n=1 Tax=Diplogelasinospora grovesii TaxID=303347 RepID=A0AAN6N0G5_9PEZI|nr:hypothetical protein QBC46DRAFT_346082 [Diplogelasinospora grovesii]